MMLSNRPKVNQTGPCMEARFCHNDFKKVMATEAEWNITKANKGC